MLKGSGMVIGAVLAGALLLPAARVWAGPHLEVREREHSWGSINQGTVATYTFHLKNTGDAPLESMEAESSCECTVPTLQKKTLAPGESGDLLITFDSKRFTGDQTKEITIHSNDPQQPEVVVRLTATVIPPLSMDPEVLDLGTVPRAGGKSQSVLITATDQKPFKILAVRTGLTFLQPKVLGASGGANTSYSVQVTAGQGAPPGPFTDFLVVTTNHGAGDTLQTMVKGEVESLFRLDPASIKFGTKPAKEDKLGDIHISFTGQGKVKFLGASTSSPALRAELKDDGTGNAATLSVYLTDKAQTGRFAGTVTVKTDSADQSELAVKVLGYIRG